MVELTADLTPRFDHHYGALYAQSAWTHDHLLTGQRTIIMDKHSATTQGRTARELARQAIEELEPDYERIEDVSLKSRARKRAPCTTHGLQVEVLFQ